MTCADSTSRPDPSCAVTPRRRVLVSAFFVSPARGSEAAGGWNLCLHLAVHHDVTVLCAPEVSGHGPFRQEIEQYLREHGPVPGLTFHFVERPTLSRLLQREGSLHRLWYYTGYASWQRAAMAEARRLHAQQPFDLIHHVNVTGYREPGYLWKLDRRIPFVWGPVGGASDMRWKFLPTMGLVDAAFYACRNLANGWQKLTAHRPRQAARAASHVFVTSEDNRRLVQDRWRHHSVEFLLDGGSAFLGSKARTDSTSQVRPLRVAWTGLHIGRKALPLLLYALREVLRTGPVELTVLGGGPLTKRWRALAQRLKVDHVVTWTGQLKHDKAVAALSEADVLAFTSLQEGTPFAVLEALSLEVPVVCHDACGMGIAVTEDCGIKIPMRTPAASIAGFADALTRLRDDNSLLRRLSAGAGRRAVELNWPTKALAIATAYERAWASRVAEGAVGGKPRPCLRSEHSSVHRSTIVQFEGKQTHLEGLKACGIANADSKCC